MICLWKEKILSLQCDMSLERKEKCYHCSIPYVLYFTTYFTIGTSYKTLSASLELQTYIESARLNLQKAETVDVKFNFLAAIFLFDCSCVTNIMSRQMKTSRDNNFHQNEARFYSSTDNSLSCTRLQISRIFSNKHFESYMIFPKISNSYRIQSQYSQIFHLSNI